MLAHPNYTEAYLLTEAGNAVAAVAISQHGVSFDAWSTYTSGAYKKFLVAVPPPPPGTIGAGTTPPLAGAPSSLAGWAQLQRSVASNLPTALKRGAAIRRAAMRKLA